MQVRTNLQQHLLIGEHDTVDLVQKYQTPLLVYDVAQIRHSIQAFKEALADYRQKTVISYASKALSIIAIYQIMQQENLHVDVVSGGELYTAFQAGFPMEKVIFHGNNKLPQELQLALELKVGMIVVDNFQELKLLSELTEENSQAVDILLRVAPGITAHTHHYIQTGQVDSKFGFDILSGQADEAFEQILQHPYLNLRGLHAHIGSQITEIKSYKLLVDRLVELAKKWNDQSGYNLSILNLGGGFSDLVEIKAFLQPLVAYVQQVFSQTQMLLPQLWLEPGRSLINQAALTLYTVGTKKSVPDICSYVAVDGGMGDNIRPALYQAQYQVVVANPRDATKQLTTVAGRYCESGDVLSSKQLIPTVQSGDIIALLNTGAYSYAMASNYNRVCRPAIVFIEHDKERLVVQRESYADLVSLDLDYL